MSFSPAQNTGSPLALRVDNLINSAAAHTKGIEVNVYAGTVECSGERITISGTTGSSSVAYSTNACGNGGNAHGYWTNVTGSNTANLGYRATVNNPAGNAIGGYFSAIGTNITHGVDAYAWGTGSINYGVKGDAKNGTNNYGVYGTASNGTLNAAGYFNGALWSASLNTISDSIFKINVNPHKNARAVLNQLNPQEYLFNKAKYPQINFPIGNQIGLIAQEVERIEPSLVSSMQHPAQYDSLGNLVSNAVMYKGVNYIGIVPILIGGFKDHDTKISNLENTIRSQQATLDQLQTQLKDVLQKLDECCSIRQRNSNINNQDIILSNETSIVLDQNSPNPFRETTKIRYVIPTDAKNARIIFYNNVGKMINEINLTVFNEGFVNVFGEDLSSGQYTYSLIIDGKLIDTKKMIKE